MPLVWAPATSQMSHSTPASIRGLTLEHCNPESSDCSKGSIGKGLSPLPTTTQALSECGMPQSVRLQPRDDICRVEGLAVSALCF